MQDSDTKPAKARWWYFVSGGLLLTTGLLGLSLYALPSWFVRARYALTHPDPLLSPSPPSSAEPWRAESSSLPNPVSTDFGLVIPKLNVNVPVVPEVEGTELRTYYPALKQGIAHYKGTALPAAGSGNVFLFGHSSPALGLPGPYSTVFALLDKLTTGDEVFVAYQGAIHRYRVREQKIVSPDDFSVLTETDQAILTVMTCWPPGTTSRRLVVVAEKEA